MPGILSDVLSFVLPILQIINASLAFALDVRLRCQTCTETWRPAHSYRLWMSTGVCQQRKLGLYFPWVQCSGILWTSFNCPRFVVFFFYRIKWKPRNKITWRWLEVDLTCMTRGWAQRDHRGSSRGAQGAGSPVHCLQELTLPEQTPAPPCHLSQKHFWIPRLLFISVYQRPITLPLHYITGLVIFVVLCPAVP